MRYVLVDYMHLAHKCIVAEPLSTTVVENGEVVLKDTTIPNYTIKSIYRYGGKGIFPIGVFLEGGKSFRKEHFKGKGRDGTGYKGCRTPKGGAFYEGVGLTVDLLHQGGVSLYRCTGYEADDLLYSMVQRIKEEDKTTPIDIITNDSDLLPLVDSQVSVYIKGTRQYSDEGCPEHRLYYQVTPETWEEYLSYTSAYKGYKLPYNSMLLFKLLKGDKADNVPAAAKGYGKVKYSLLMEDMIAKGVEFDKIFRYGVDFDEKMRPVLSGWFKDEEIERMKFNYEGIGLRAVNVEKPKQISYGHLQKALDGFRINLR